MNLNTPVESVTLIGPVRKKQLDKCGIRTVGHLRKKMRELGGPQNLRIYLFGVFGIHNINNDATVSYLVEAATGLSQ